MENCYNTNPRKLSRQELADQDDRLTRRHLDTLGFTQDLARQNKILTSRIKELELLLGGNHKGQTGESILLSHHSPLDQAEMQAKLSEIELQYKRRLEELSAALMTKHEETYNNLINEKAQSEKIWLSEKNSLLTKISTLEYDFRECRAVKEKLEFDLASNERQIRQLENKLLESEKRVSHANQIQTDLAGQVNQITSLKSQYEELRQEHEATLQVKQELEFKIEQLQLDKANDAKVEREQQKIITKLKSNMAGTDSNTKKAREQIMELENKIIQLQKDKESLIAEKTSMTAEIASIRQELIRLQNLISDNHQYVSNNRKRDSHVNVVSNNNIAFEEYVCLKREVNALKDENALLKSRLKSPQGDRSQKTPQKTKVKL